MYLLLYLPPLFLKEQPALQLGFNCWNILVPNFQNSSTLPCPEIGLKVVAGQDFDCGNETGE